MVTKKEREKGAHVIDIPQGFFSPPGSTGVDNGRMGNCSEIKTPGNTQGPGDEKREDDQKKKAH